MAKALNKGDMQELRIARLLYAEGAFVRRAIDLNMRFGEDLTVTDLDVFALKFAKDFEISTVIGESKTAQGKKGPKLADRLLWICGLRDLIGADRAFIATAKSASSRVRGLAEKLDVRVIDEPDLVHRERLIGLQPDASWGPYDPRLLERQRTTYDLVKENADLKRIYWFIRSEFWLLDDTTSIKRALWAINLLGQYWGGNSGKEQRRSIRWLTRHLQVNIVVGLVRLAGRCYREDPRKSSAQILQELASGPNVDYETMAGLARDVDRYLTTVLRDLDADPGQQVKALGAFSPSPPSYAEPLLEVVERLAAEPEVSPELPRFIDHEVARLELEEDIDLLHLDGHIQTECARLLRLIGAFVIGQMEVPGDLLDTSLGGRSVSDEKSDSPRGAAEVDQASEPASVRDDSASKLFDDSTTTKAT